MLGLFVIITILRYNGSNKSTNTSRITSYTKNNITNLNRGNTTNQRRVHRKPRSFACKHGNCDYEELHVLDGKKTRVITKTCKILRAYTKQGKAVARDNAGNKYYLNTDTPTEIGSTVRKQRIWIEGIDGDALVKLVYEDNPYCHVDTLQAPIGNAYVYEHIPNHIYGRWDIPESGQVEVVDDKGSKTTDPFFIHPRNIHEIGFRSLIDHPVEVYYSIEEIKNNGKDYLF